MTTETTPKSFPHAFVPPYGEPYTLLFPSAEIRDLTVRQIRAGVEHESARGCAGFKARVGALLRKIAWMRGCGCDNDGEDCPNSDTCPVCGAYGQSDLAHKDDCALAALLKECGA